MRGPIKTGVTVAVPPSPCAQMPRVDPELVRAVVQDHLKKHGYDGSLTARVVREETERRCGMQPGSLKDQKEALMQAIEAVLGEQPKTPAPQTGAGAGGGTATSQADRASARAAVEADPEAAERLLQAAEAAAEPAPLLEQLEASCSSGPAAERLVAAGLVPRLARRIQPGSDRQLAALAVRVLTAASLHDGLTGQMLKASELVPALLAALAAAAETLAIPLVDLVHNLADSDANRLRLTAGGCLPALTRQMLEPAGSATIKEHTLNAVASLAGEGSGSGSGEGETRRARPSVPNPRPLPFTAALLPRPRQGFKKVK